MHDTKRHNLRYARTTAGYTQKEAAEMLGVSKATVQRMEAGTSAIPEHKLKKFIKECDVDLTEVQKEAEEKRIFEEQLKADIAEEERLFAAELSTYKK